MLIVEDNFLIAEQLSELVRGEGGLVVGPVATCEAACALIESRRLSGALLDVNLLREDSSPVARLLKEKAVPFLVVTGYERDVLPSRFLRAPYLAKPFSESALIELASATFRA